MSYKSKLPDWAVVGLYRVLLGGPDEPLVERFIFKGGADGLRLRSADNGGIFYYTLGTGVVDEEGDDGLAGQVIEYRLSKPAKVSWFAHDYKSHPGFTHCLWVKTWPTSPTKLLAEVLLTIEAAAASGK